MLIRIHKNVLIFLISLFLQCISPAIGGSYPGCVSKRYEFDDPSDLNDFTVESGTVRLLNGKLRLEMEYNSAINGGVLTMISHRNLFWFGTIKVSLRTIGERGAITTFILREPGALEGRGEIDLEWLGRNSSEVQTNVFAKGHLIFNKHGGKHYLESRANRNFNTYSIEWGSKHIRWMVGDNVIRTRVREKSFDPDVNDYIFPDLPMQLQSSVWDTGTHPNRGIGRWGGAPTLWEARNFSALTAEIDWIELNCTEPDPLPEGIDVPVDMNIANFNETELTNSTEGGGYILPPDASFGNVTLPTSDAEVEMILKGLLAMSIFFCSVLFLI